MKKQEKGRQGRGKRDERERRRKRGRIGKEERGRGGEGNEGREREGIHFPHGRLETLTALVYGRSCSRRDLRIPRYRLSRYGSRSFSVSGPTAWNSLPTAVRDLSSSSCFCRRLNTELFSRAYGVN